MYIVRAYDRLSKTWVHLLPESEVLKDALRKVRTMRCMVRRDKGNSDVCAWDIIEVAHDDASGLIELQLIATPTGYHRVTGR